jgi:hypothetical protein
MDAPKCPDISDILAMKAKGRRVRAEQLKRSAE